MGITKKGSDQKDLPRAEERLEVEMMGDIIARRSTVAKRSRRARIRVTLPQPRHIRCPGARLCTCA